MKRIDLFVIAMQCVWAACEIDIKRRMTATGDNADKTSYKLLYSVTIASLILGITAGWILRFVHAPGLYSGSSFFPVSGIILIAFGLGIRLNAIATLKKYFTVNVTIQADHQLVTTGMYRYIRHPAYAGGIVSFIGCALCYGNPVSFVLIAVPYTLLILSRIRQEEEALTGKFGQAYKELQARTKKLIPKIY